jgi:anti-sigma regulatory factor (Ser/Thr protein kinase)
VPYIICPQCGLRLYTAAAWTSRDECPSCSLPLVPDQAPGSKAQVANLLSPRAAAAPAFPGSSKVLATGRKRAAAPPKAVEVCLPGGAKASQKARAAVAAYLGGQLDPARLDDLLIITSEVVSNAVLHAGAGPGEEVGLRVTIGAESVHVAVSDPAPDLPPRIKPLDPLRAGGLGLNLLDHLSERWGVEHPAPGTKEVWFEFLLAPPRLEPGFLGVRGRPHVACPDCGLRLYTADAWALLERCPRCEARLTRHPASTSQRREDRGRGFGHEA